MEILKKLVNIAIEEFKRSQDPAAIQTVRRLKKTEEAARILLADQDTEGRKEGYADAAAEYEPIYTALKEEYDALISDLKCRRAVLDRDSKEGLEKLRELEEEEEQLKEELAEKVRSTAQTIQVPAGEIQAALGKGTYGITSQGWEMVLNWATSGKKKERAQARSAGYAEAKELYRKKLDKLRAHYRKVKKEATAESQEYGERVAALLREIEQTRFRIADLKLALQE